MQGDERNSHAGKVYERACIQREKESKQQRGQLTSKSRAIKSIGERGTLPSPRADGGAGGRERETAKY